MISRYGKIDKIILLDLYSLVRRGDRLAFKDRSQLIYNIYVMKNGDFESPFRDIIKHAIEDKEYNKLQVSVTRSLGKLELAGLIERKQYELNRNRGADRSRERLGILGRKFYFSLTSSGISAAKAIAMALKLEIRPLNRRRIASAVLKLKHVDI